MMTMKIGTDYGLHRMDAETVLDLGDGYAKYPASMGIVHPPHNRAKSGGALVGGLKRDAEYGWPADEAGNLLSSVRHLGCKNPNGYEWFAFCVTHSHAVPVMNRAALWHGAVHCAAKDTLDSTGKRRTISTAGKTNLRDGLPVVPVAWCPGCSSAVDASV